VDAARRERTLRVVTPATFGPSLAKRVRLWLSPHVMNRWAATAFLLMSSLAGLVGCREASEGARDGGELALGGQAYLAQCSVCHGAYGEGDGPLAASIAAEQRPQPARFSAGSVRSLGRVGVARVLEGRSHRRPDAPMPVWGQPLGREWTNRIAAWVANLPRLDARGRAAVARYLAPVGTSGEGRRTYVLHCSSCHGADGGGEGFFAPELAIAPPPLDGGVLATRSDDELAKFLAPGGAHLERVPNVPGWAYTISPAERGELIRYLRRLPDSPNGN
jgi:mono/diheme cytochrome c family protein